MQIGELLQTVGDVVIHPCGNDLRAALAARSILDAKITAACHDFDTAQLWDLDNRKSLADWLRVECSVSNVEARRMALLARRTADLPAVAAAWEAGELSTAQVQAATNRLTDRRRSEFTELEAVMAALFASLDVAGIEQTMQRYVDAYDAAHPDPLPDEPANTLYLSSTFGDRGVLHASLSPLNTANLEAALAIAETRDVVGEPRVPAERRADALDDIVNHYLRTHDQPPKRRHHPHVALNLTPQQLANGLAGRTLDGRLLPGPDIGMLACDSVTRRIVNANGEIIELGRTVRTAPHRLFLATAARDHKCRFPGCDAPAKWCDAHHVIPWWPNGWTGITNLALLCRRHHRKLHTPGWAAKLLPDGTLEITTPQGTTLTTRPPDPGGKPEPPT